MSDKNMIRHNLTRRRFVQGTAAAIAAPLLFSSAKSAAGDDTLAIETAKNEDQKNVLEQKDGSAEYSLKGRLYKTLKVGMTSGVKGSLTDKFRAAKEAGFMGIEMNSPGMDVEQTKTAIAESGLTVDGSVCSTHWQIRHTSPSAEERAKALADLQIALRDTNAVGGKTVLLVNGKGEDGTKEEIWKRSIDNITLALPLAAELGVSIVLENVWNGFLYDPQGDHTQTADEYAKYVDEVNSPWFGMQFDIGNHWKFGSMGDWIRTLGKRIYKLDLKGFSRAESKFTNIGEGDLDWKDVRKALLEINYYGWAAAEVGGGDLARLKEVSANMDKVFALN